MMKKLLACALVLSIAACGSDDSGGDRRPDSDTAQKTDKHDPSKIKDDPAKNLICPQVAILQAGEEHVDYGGETPDPSQLVAKARMNKIEGDCGYRPDGIDITFTLRMTAKRGPRLGGQQVSYSYFTAIIDPADTIISRQLNTAQFTFSGSDPVAADDEDLHVFIPVAENLQQGGPDYRVLVGFQERPQ